MVIAELEQRIAELEQRIDELQEQYRAATNSGERRIIAGRITEAADRKAWARYHKAIENGVQPKIAFKLYIR